MVLEPGDLINTGTPPGVGMGFKPPVWLQPGDVMTVYIYPAKSGNPVGRLNKVVFADGKTLRDSQLGGDKSKDQ
jgi:2-keto-4-pentenoate hydratase/2-oxohepta-3-ene-1,7-dioic acid hydratase in catechol pathway